MSEQRHDIIYSAQDIEKYHKGLLSAKEMHAMEKAALDDSFLADAMEGYQETDSDINADLAELKERLAKKTEDTKRVIPLISSRSKWLRVAAMIVAIGGAGILVYQFGFKDGSSKNIAMEPSAPAKEIRQQAITEKSDTVILPGADAGKKSTDLSETKQEFHVEKPATLYNQEKEGAARNSLAKTDSNLNDQVIVDNMAAPSPSVEEKAIRQDEVAFHKMKAQTVQGNNQAARKESNAKTQPGSNRNWDSIFADKDQRSIASGASTKNERDFGYSTQSNSRANLFRGQVRDANNNALPFANITNTNDNVGTYSDVQGRFILTSPDTVLNVQVRSLGFESSNVQLRNNIPSNEVTLQDDSKSLAEVVVSNKKVNTARARNQTMILEEPEPADGWENYDTYLANNLKLPESFKTRASDNGGNGGEVELSFEVSKNGEPINIKVVKSLCEKCDKEAIRLLKDGPKWKRKKKGRTSVRIAF